MVFLIHRVSFQCFLSLLKIMTFSLYEDLTTDDENHLEFRLPRE